jgi:apolipoprotein N-acyltransferase
MLALVLYLSLFPAFFGLFFAASSGSSVAARVVVAPSLWVALEYLRGYLFTGFPWAVLGYTQAPYLPVIQIADNTGVWGVSFLVVAVTRSLP